MIAILADGELTRNILIEAHEMGMGNGEYAFIGIELLKQSGSSSDFSWYKSGDRRNKAAREIYESLMVIAVRVPTSPEYSSFMHKVGKMSSEQFGGVKIQDNVRPISMEANKVTIMNGVL